MHLLLRNPQGNINRFTNKPFSWDSAGTGISLDGMPLSAPAGGQRSGRLVIASGKTFDFSGVYITARNGVWYLKHGEEIPPVDEIQLFTDSHAHKTLLYPHVHDIDGNVNGGGEGRIPSAQDSTHACTTWFKSMIFCT